MNSGIGPFSAPGIFLIKLEPFNSCAQRLLKLRKFKSANIQMQGCKTTALLPMQIAASWPREKSRVTGTKQKQRSSLEGYHAKQKTHPDLPVESSRYHPHSPLPETLPTLIFATRV
jgi:hypothetical protein